jgi:hypothetical protein
MKKFSLCLLMFLLCTLSLSAQKDNKDNNSPYKQNIVKLNLTSLILKNISVQYERSITRKSAFALGVRYAPASALPFKSLIKENVLEDDTDPSVSNTIDRIRLSNIAITPEYRFYLGKGYGKGFYIAPFYRFAIFDIKDVNIVYDETVTPNQSIDLSGKFTSHTGGLLLGAQFNLGKSVTLDLWILGPAYGVGKGNIKGTSPITFTQEDKDNIRQELDELDIPLTDKSYEITDNSVILKLTGPWAGLRSGITVGIRF